MDPTEVKSSTLTKPSLFTSALAQNCGGALVGHAVKVGVFVALAEPVVVAVSVDVTVDVVVIVGVVVPVGVVVIVGVEVDVAERLTAPSVVTTGSGCDKALSSDTCTFISETGV
jgi:hypothetical protein